MASITTRALLEMKEKGERIVALTCYDALFARLLDACGIDILLVGDSLNQVLARTSSGRIQHPQKSPTVVTP